MTGAAAVVDPRPGGRFSAWDGYITGRTLEVEPGRRIVQSWQTSEFDDETEDSRIEVVLVPAGQGTEITIRHSNVPSDQRGYEEGGWQESYFEPMRTYFAAPGRRHLSSKGGPTRNGRRPVACDARHRFRTRGEAPG